MADRFDLEQGLLNSWNIIEDLKDIIETERYDLLQSVIAIYDFKFEKTFDIFGEIIQSEFSFKKQLNELKLQHEEELEQLRKLHSEQIADIKRNNTLEHYTGSF